MAAKENALQLGIKTKLCDKPNQGKVVSVSCRYSNYFMLAGTLSLQIDGLFTEPA